MQRILGSALIVGMCGSALLGQPARVAPVHRLAVVDRSNSTPWMTALGDVVAIAWGAGTKGEPPDVFVAVSRDAGATFGAPVRVNDRAADGRLGGELPPRVALVAAPGGAFDVIVVWGAKREGTEIRTARSRDGGRTFLPSRPLQAAGAAGDRGWHSLAVDERGMAHAMWLDHRGLAAAESSHGEGHTSTTDGVAMAQRSGLYYASAGDAPSAERELFKGVCYCCKTALLATPGRLYAAWRHVYAGNIRDIAFTSSSDGGRTFSAPARVSQDDWMLNGCPDDGPAMVADAAGTVHIVWPTVIGGAQPQGALFYASTRDGVTFTPRQRIATLGAPRPQHPQIAIDVDGQPVVAWDELRTGTRTAALARLRRDAAGTVTQGPIAVLDDAAPSAYPVLAASGGHLLAAWTSGAPGASSIAVRRVD